MARCARERGGRRDARRSAPRHPAASPPLVRSGGRCYMLRMRRVGELQSEQDARSFHDALVARGIENTAFQAVFRFVG